jgi:hypothetical protein
MKRILAHPAFDLSEQDPVQCFSALARGASRHCFDFLSTVPGLDINRPLPHGVNGFPDTRLLPVRNRHTLMRLGPFARPHATEGIAPIFSLHPSDVVELSALATRRIDLDQRGKHGQTILFTLTRSGHYTAGIDELVSIDHDARDRHGNTAVGCAVLSRHLYCIREPMNVCQSDFLMKNENGDSPLELIALRRKRSA